MRDVVNYCLKLPDDTETNNVNSPYQALIGYHFMYDHLSEDTSWQSHIRCRRPW